MNKPKRRVGCCSNFFILFFLTLFYFLTPISNRFLLLGIDRTPIGTQIGRSDTLIVFSVNPFIPTVKMLSIPRDLWVTIPSIGENRINTAHFFAESQKPGSGPYLTMDTIDRNFSIRLKYYVRFNLNHFPGIIDAMGGIQVDLPTPMAGFPAGSYLLDGTQALAFVRSRSDGDDFFRISQGQLFIGAFIRRMLNPEFWPRLPAVISAASNAFDTNLPVWLWPRIGFALLRASIFGIENYSIDRSMVTPYTTTEGAQVLLPNWEMIHIYIKQIF
jgi:LCP family protein required for cell wall assembly